jgi:hypothetical protein
MVAVLQLLLLLLLSSRGCRGGGCAVAGVSHGLDLQA